MEIDANRNKGSLLILSYERFPEFLEDSSRVLGWDEVM